MSLYRRAPRRDGAEPAIVAALSALGCSVQPLSGKGVPDLLVGIRGLNILLECKAPVGPLGGTHGRELTDDQRIWHATWRGSKPWLVRSAEDAIASVRAAIEEAE